MLLTPAGPLWFGHSHGALGLTPNHCRFLNEVCDVPPLCLCTGWSFFENSFPLVHLAKPIHPLGFLSGKPSCSARHVGSLLWANTVFTHLSVTGLSRLDCGLSYLSVSLTTWEVLWGRDWALPNSESQDPEQGLAEWVLNKLLVNQRRNEWVGLACGLERVLQFTTSSAVCTSSRRFYSSASSGRPGLSSQGTLLSF